MSSPDEPVIRPLGVPDVAAFIDLRRASLADTPMAFGADAEHDRASDTTFVTERFAATDAGGDDATFGAFEDGRLIGCCGVVRPVGRKRRHLAELWGMYVEPAQRGRGLGRRLVAAALDRAEAMDGVLGVTLCVSDADPRALVLYRGCGFELWGTEPASMGDGERFVPTHHMTRWFADAPGEQGTHDDAR